VHRWRKARRTPLTGAHPGAAARALVHRDYTRDEEHERHLASPPPPQYHEAPLGKDIEMQPTSPTVREFV
jgi:hypothetical protein